jgi:hypothetical protein
MGSMEMLQKLLLATVAVTAIAIATTAGIGIASHRPGTATDVAAPYAVEAAASSAVFCVGTKDMEGRYLARDPQASC